MKLSQLFSQTLRDAHTARETYRSQQKNTKKIRIVFSSILILASFVCLGMNAYFAKHLSFIETIGYLSRLLLLLLAPVVIVSLLFLAILFLYRKLKKK